MKCKYLQECSKLQLSSVDCVFLKTSKGEETQIIETTLRQFPVDRTKYVVLFSDKWEKSLQAYQCCLPRAWS